MANKIIEAHILEFIILNQNYIMIRLAVIDVVINESDNNIHTIINNQYSKELVEGNNEEDLVVVFNIDVKGQVGSLCYQKDNINEMQYKINLTSFANGLYIVYAEFNNQVLTQKIILEK